MRAAAGSVQGVRAVAGTLLNRMLGQKKIRGDAPHGSSAVELCTRFPRLHAAMLTHLQAVTTHAHGRMRLQPMLFPVLSILSKLSSGVATHDHRWGHTRPQVGPHTTTGGATHDHRWGYTRTQVGPHMTTSSVRTSTGCLQHSLCSVSVKV